MYEMKYVGMAEAEVAVKAIIREASKSSGPITVAVAAPDGYLVYLARMDGAPWNSVVMAIKKAYSAARMRNNTRAMQSIQERGWIDAGSSFGDDITIIPGGLSITEPVEGSGKPGPPPVSYGGIGISGRPADDDEALTFIGLKALQDFLWPKS